VGNTLDIVGFEVLTVWSLPTFRRGGGHVPQSSRPKSKPSKWEAEQSVCCSLLAGYSVGLLLDPEDGASVFRRNLNYTSSLPRK
jgi:hypothetical protein